MNKYRIIILVLATIMFGSILYIQVKDIKRKNKEWHKLPDIVQTIKPGDTVIISNPTDTLYIEIYNRSLNKE